MPRDASYSYVLLVGSLLLASCLASGVVPTDARNRPDSNSIPAAAGIEDEPTIPSNPYHSPTEKPETTTTQPEEVRRHLGPVTVTIFLNCSYLAVHVEPTTFEFVLELVYRDTESGQRIPLLAGPFTGSVDDPFGRTGLELLEVRVRVERVPPTGQFAPERCLPG